MTWAVGQGLSQFIDLGCGMPTVPNTHQTAQAVTAAARVAYVDHDPVVLTHLRALAAKDNPGVTVVGTDVRETDATLGAIAAGIDMAAPVCLLMGFLLHFLAPGAARDLVAGYVAALAPGSYIVLSVGRADSDASAKGFGVYSAGTTQVYNHSVPEFASFFGSLELVPPGVTDAREWRPDWEQPVHLPPRAGQVIVGIARVS